jgi:cell division GTPase FtsZ
MDEREIVESLMARQPKEGVFVLADDDGNPIGDVTALVMRLLVANGGWQALNKLRASRFLTTGREAARAVGAELDARYGLEAMQAVCEIIDDLLPDAGAELEEAWAGIGGWQA